jgi:hypothetical protein
MSYNMESLSIGYYVGESLIRKGEAWRYSAPGFDLQVAHAAAGVTAPGGGGMDVLYRANTLDVQVGGQEGGVLLVIRA